METISCSTLIDIVKNTINTKDSSSVNVFKKLVNSDDESARIFPDKTGNLILSYSKNQYDEPLGSKQRINTTIGRYFRRVIGVSVNDCPDKVFDRLVSDLSIKIRNRLETAKPKLKLLKGKEISKFYETTFINSCMTGKVKSNRTELYALNPDKVSLAVLELQKRDVARALLWKCDDGTIYLDRIYSSDGYSTSGLLKEAVKNTFGDKIKTYDREDSNLVVTCKAKTYLPYLDTFYMGKIASAKQKKIILSTDENSGDYADLYDMMCGDKLCWEQWKCDCCNKLIAGNGKNDTIKVWTSLTKFTTKHVCTDCFDDCNNTLGEIMECYCCNNHFIATKTLLENKAYDDFCSNWDSYCPDCFKTEVKKCKKCKSYFDLCNVHKKKHDSEYVYYCDECYEIVREKELAAKTRAKKALNKTAKKTKLVKKTIKTCGKKTR